MYACSEFFQVGKPAKDSKKQMIKDEGATCIAIDLLSSVKVNQLNYKNSSHPVLSIQLINRNNKKSALLSSKKTHQLQKLLA